MKKLIVLCLLPFALALGRQETVISGKLLGHDGKPMKQAHVHLLKPGESKPLAKAQADAEGTFRIATSRTGLLFLQGTGVDHAEYRAAILIDKPQSLEVEMQLKMYPFLKEFTDVKIMGDFNNFNFNTAEPMEKQPDGTFTAEFEVTENTFKYQLLGLTPTARSVNGTMSEDFVYDDGGDYQSVVTPKNGKVHIVFDPKKVKASDASAAISIKDNPVLNRFASLMVDMANRGEKMNEARASHQRAGKDMKTFSYDWSTDVAKLANQIQSENEPTIRQLLLLQYIQMGQFGAKNLDPTLAAEVLKSVPFESPLWLINPMLVRFAVTLSGQSDSGEVYFDQFLQRQPDKLAKGALLFNEAMMAQFAGNADKLKKYYDILISEYQDTQFGVMAKQRLTPNTKVAKGKPVPGFSVVSMEAPGKVISKESLRGKFYLLDFWAVWCGPCIAEMGNLHQAYEKFKTKNFEILSLSFDPKVGDVVKFRNGKWKMPWQHSFVEGGFTSELAKQFEVIGIPKPILVDANGTIVATDTELRGENLEKTLTRVLGATN